MKAICQRIGQQAASTAALLLGLGFFLGSAAMASAQEITGVITGKVTGPHGAPINGATIDAIDVNRNVTVTVKSDANGIYHVTGLPLGRYEIIASRNGYHTWKHRSFTLSFHQIARINVSMGTLCEVCSTEPEIPLLQTDSSEVRTTIDGSVFVNLQRP